MREPTQNALDNVNLMLEQEALQSILIVLLMIADHHNLTISKAQSSDSQVSVLLILYQSNLLLCIAQDLTLQIKLEHDLFHKERLTVIH